MRKSAVRAESWQSEASDGSSAWSARAWLVAACLAIAAIAGCGGPPSPRLHVPVVLEVDPSERDAARDRFAEASQGLEVELAEVERPALASPPAQASPDFGAIRRAYDDGDLEACLAALPDEAALASSLSRGDRTTASRALFWRMACLRALGREDEALTSAREHAARALPLPDDLGAANAVAETMLRDAHREASSRARVPLAISTFPAGATLEIDGLRENELAPTTIALLEGPHLVRVTLATYAPQTIALEVREGRELAPLAVTLVRAEPEPALEALSDRLAEGRDLDDDVSLSLLVVGLRSRALVLVSRDDDRTRAALVTLEDDAPRGTVVRAERVGQAQWDLRGLFEDVLVRGALMARPPELYERAELWIGVAAAIAIAAGVALAVTIEPDVRTRVTW
ncbi:MAG: hypothetical protein K1X94_11710 [Sandaracinaceae bacterium]|nr:hypothetical protein [Sandaracinaceae bacterium]